MIGGAMLLCAVGAMLLLALWSLTRDDAPDAEARDGILALRVTGGPVKPRPQTASRHRRTPARQPRPLDFDPHEMAEIAEEAQATLPRFVRDAREDY